MIKLLSLNFLHPSSIFTCLLYLYPKARVRTKRGQERWIRRFLLLLCVDSRATGSISSRSFERFSVCSHIFSVLSLQSFSDTQDLILSHQVCSLTDPSGSILWNFLSSSFIPRYFLIYFQPFLPTPAWLCVPRRLMLQMTVFLEIDSFNYKTL